MAVLAAAVSLLAGGHAALAAQWCEPTWGPAGVSVSSGLPLKGKMLVLPGDRDVVVAWEENRVRKPCCRDVRDVFARYVDARGRAGGKGPVPLAVDEAGEELLGLRIAGRTAGAAVIRREAELLLTGFGRRGASAEPRRLFAAERLDLHGPSNGFALSPAGDRGMVAWTVDLPEPEAGVYACTLRLGKGGWEPGPAVRLTNEAGAHAAQAVGAAGGWYVQFWERTEGGARLRGGWLDADGRLRNGFGMLAEFPEATYVRAVAHALGGDRVLVTCEAENLNRFTPDHEAMVFAVSRDGSGEEAIARSSIGHADSRYLLIPAPTISTATEERREGTPERVVWFSRLTARAGPGSVAAAARIHAGGLFVNAVSVGSRIEVSPPVQVRASPLSECAPWMLPPRTDSGYWILGWVERGSTGNRFRAQRIEVRPGRVKAIGETADLSGPLEFVPRDAAAEWTGPDRFVVAWTAFQAPDAGRVAIQEVRTKKETR